MMCMSTTLIKISGRQFGISCTREEGHPGGHVFPAPDAEVTPIHMILFCPHGHRHVDKPPFADKPHHTHACQECGIVWRPAIVPTVGVQFLPGFKDGE